MLQEDKTDRIETLTTEIDSEVAAVQELAEKILGLLVAYHVAVSILFLHTVPPLAEKFKPYKVIRC